MDAINAVRVALQAGSIAVPGLLLQQYAELGLLENEVMILIHVLYAIEHDRIDFPTPEFLAQRMSMPESRVLSGIERLVRDGFLTIELVTERGVVGERYDVSALYHKIATVAAHRHGEESLDEPSNRKATSQRRKNIFTLFESEFARTLSPDEYEIIVNWIDRDGCSDTLIMAALKEAVFSGKKLNCFQVDRILHEWLRQGITDPDQMSLDGR